MGLCPERHNHQEMTEGFGFFPNATGLQRTSAAETLGYLATYGNGPNRSCARLTIGQLCGGHWPGLSELPQQPCPHIEMLARFLNTSLNLHRGMKQGGSFSECTEIIGQMLNNFKGWHV